MKVYVLVSVEVRTIVGVFADYDVALQVSKAYDLSGHPVFLSTSSVSNEIPQWCSKVLSE